MIISVYDDIEQKNKVADIYEIYIATELLRGLLSTAEVDENFEPQVTFKVRHDVALRGIL